MKAPTILLIASILLINGATALGEDTGKITFVDDILPILEDKCVNCHNPDESKGGLDLSTFSATMTGGSGGDIVVSEDPTGSRLYSLAAHLEEPFMPPKGTQADEKELKLLSDWVASGLLETQSSTARKSDKPKIDFNSITSTGKPEGPPAMPEHLILEPAILTERPNSVPAMAHSPWAPILAVAGQKQVLLFHSEDYDLLGVLPYPEGFPQTLSFSPNGAYLSCGGGRAGKSGNVVAWDIKTGERIIEVGKEYDIVLGSDISPDLKSVILGGPGRNIKIWDTVAGEQINSIKKHPDWLLTAAYSPDGVIFATGGRNGGLYVWESATGYEFHTLKGHTKAVTDIAWRPDGDVLASCSEDGQVMIWEMNEGKQVKKWEADKEGALAITFAPNGNLATVGRDKTVKIWQGDGKLLRSIPASDDVVLSVAFSHDSKRVFTGDWHGNIKVWNADNGAELASIAPNPPTIEDQLAYSEKRIRELTGELPKLEAGVQTVSKEVVEAKAQLAAVAKANETATQTLNTQKGSVAKSEGQIKTFTTQVTAAQAAVTAKNAAVKKVTEQLAAATNALKPHQDKVAALKAAAGKEETTLKATSASLIAATSEAAKPALNAERLKQHDQFSAARVQAEKSKQASEAALASEMPRRKEAATALELLNKNSVNSMAQLEKTKATLAEAESKLVVATAARVKAAEAIREASKDGKTPPENLNTAHKAAIAGENSSKSFASATRSDLAKTTESHQQAVGEVNQKGSEIKALNAEVAAANADLKSKSEAFNTAEATFKPLREALAAGKARHVTAQAKLAAAIAAQQQSEKKRSDIVIQLATATKALEAAIGSANNFKALLVKAQAEAKTANDGLVANRTQLDTANKQFATTQDALKKAETTLAGATQKKEAGQAKVDAVVKKEAATKKSIALAKEELKDNQFLVKKWEAAAINLSAHQESEELVDMRVQLENLKEDETEAKTEVVEATQARVDAEKTLADAKTTIAAGTRELRQQSTSVLEQALELVASRAVTELREDLAEESGTLIADVEPDLSDSSALLDELEPEEVKIETVAAETLAYKSRDELNAEVEALRGRLNDLENLLETSYTKADKTKASVDQAGKVARNTPTVIAQRAKSEEDAAHELADAEAERMRQETELEAQKKRIEELKQKYIKTVPERD